MSKLRILLTLNVIPLLFVIGCVEADRIISDVNNVATGVGDFLESPAGQIVPPDWRLYGSLAVLLTSAITNGYQKWRSTQMTKTTKAIVKGIEKAEKADKTEENSSSPLFSSHVVKQAIAKEMRSAKCYDVGNKIVDRLKIG